ncbi:MAG: hypothetical protein KC646_01460 [Candidatus Cloacimonetes bacterium]|nr:hypothetical protein [Candidatus Cloacimonadota bacterium]
MKLLLLFIFSIQFCYGENLAQLENMYRKTGNLEALYYLGKGLIAEKRYKKASRVIKVLHKKLPNSPKVLTLDIKLNWESKNKYRAYKLAHEFPDSDFRSDHLAYIKSSNEALYPYFRIRYEFESSKIMDEENFEKLLKLFPRNKLLLQLLMDYFVFLEEYEFAYDFALDYPDIFTNVEKFEKLGNLYGKNCKSRINKHQLDEETKLSCYYAYKFTPFEMTGYKKMSLKNLIWFFEAKLSHRQSNTYENHYRLAYLYARIKETENAKRNLAKAIEKSPSYFFDLVLEKLPSKFMTFKEDSRIEYIDIKSLPGAKEKLKGIE